MQGILQSHYKQIETYINKLQQENLENQYCPYYDTILEHKEKFYDIYNNYRETFEKMSLITKQFQEHKQSIKRLIVMQKNKKKEMLKLTSNAAKNKLMAKSIIDFKQHAQLSNATAFNTLPKVKYK